MGGAFGTYGGEETWLEGLVGKPDVKESLEDVEVDGMIILEWIFKKQKEDVDCIYLAQNRSKWRTLVNTVVILGFP
jgi:hypothetical protein